MTNEAKAGRKALKILIADDDPAILRVLADRCEEIGFDVETATNGLHALIMARQRQPDILIVDVNMPELDGLSLCTRLLVSGKKSFDVIVVTGSEDAETAERCESIGAFYGSKKSNFWNSISIALAEIAPEMSDRIQHLGEVPAGSKIPVRPRVLLIDDDSDLNAWLSTRLAKFNVETLYAANAVEGYKIARKEKPSVILCDYFMPNGDAGYLLNKLRGAPETESIPVIVWTGKVGGTFERDLMREYSGHPGAAKVIQKSANCEPVLEILKRYCGFHTNGWEE